ncbi:hypothetical protein [Flavobacterium sp. JAS]|uniref:hypothetical protein n=1 Tax=Flavobacterium sp. JAS TaxID=2897329 RepID=UPI001E4B8177|nr:hypothetical protein [Flavobacterium sp. JAS]MCD0471804.1 hypothetical protein [Flavobacterium sp. JAS]
MYSKKTGLTLGFHGCDESIGLDIVNHKTKMKLSSNVYDWLGHGYYFWENSLSRAKEYIAYKKKHPVKGKIAIAKPFVFGAVIDLQHCLDLTDYDNLKEVKAAHEFLIEMLTLADFEIPQNRNVGSNKDLWLRDLDCAVINTVHKMRKDAGLEPYDSIKGIFVEGNALYKNAGFKTKNHIQLCIVNPNCIKGYFIPRKKE